MFTREQAVQSPYKNRAPRMNELYTLGVARKQQQRSSSVLRRVQNPIRMSEDEADVLISERRLSENLPLTPLETYLKKHGVTLERSAGTSRRNRT